MIFLETDPSNEGKVVYILSSLYVWYDLVCRVLYDSRSDEKLCCR